MHIDDVTFCITTLDRYENLKELLDSIRKFYPDGKILVADQSKEINAEFYQEYENLLVIPLPYDCGLSFARNKLAEQSNTDFILILEDDFLFTENTVVEKMLLLSSYYDIIGGAVYKNDKRIPFEFYLEKIGDTLYQTPDEEMYMNHMGVKFKETGCMLNFLLINRKVFNDVKWDDRLKLREHQHFFYKAKGQKICFTPDVKIIDNKKGQSKDYKALKGRDEFWKIAMKDIGITKVKYLSGRVVELEGGLIHRYKENI